jgi:hypothetical protein
MHDIQENERGWDYRRLLGPWLATTTTVDVHEPYLHQPFQREALAHLLDLLRVAGVRDVLVVTMAGHREPGDEGPEALMAGMDSLKHHWARMGVRVRLELCDFHQRRLVLWQERGGAVELWMDRGLHFWRRPRVEAERVALAARRTMAQTVLIRTRAGPSGGVRDAPQPTGGAGCARSPAPP